jgi:hypothetical protein
MLERVVLHYGPKVPLYMLILVLAQVHRRGWRLDKPLRDSINVIYVMFHVIHK